MKTNRQILMLSSIIFMISVWGFMGFGKDADLFQGLNLLLFILIIGVAVIAGLNMIKKDKEKKEGIPVDDELSTKIKYKAGYKAYMASMYMWLFIFFFKNYFPNTESMLGGGILLSALIFFIKNLRETEFA